MLAEIMHKIIGFEKEDAGPYYPRPSIAGPERCIRQMTYWGNGTPQDKLIADRAISVMDDSRWQEELSADTLRKSVYKVHSEQMPIDCLRLDFLKKIPTHYCKICEKESWGDVLHGHIDWMIKDILDNEYLIEHKAINHFAFIRYWNGEMPLDYFAQCCLYLTGIQRVLNDIDRAILLVKNKNTSQFIDYKLFYEHENDNVHVEEICHSNGEKKIGNPYLFTMEKVVGNAVDKFALVHRFTESKTLPERPFQYGTKWPCGYCNYGDTCWEGYQEEFEARLDEGTLPEEYLDACRYYLELNGHISAMQEEKDEIRDKIIEAIKIQNAKKARIGEYVVTVRLQEFKSLDQDAPEVLRKQCTKTSTKEILTIRKPKPKMMKGR
jgi:hypothetical protein